MAQELVQVLTIIVLLVLFLQHLTHVLVILQAVLTLIQVIFVYVQAEVVALIQRKQDVLLHHVHVQLAKVHLMVVIALAVGILVLMENVSALVECNTLVEAVGLHQYQTFVLLDKFHLLLAHVLVQVQHC